MEFGRCALCLGIYLCKSLIHHTSYHLNALACIHPTWLAPPCLAQMLFNTDMDLIPKVVLLSFDARALEESFTWLDWQAAVFLYICMASRSGQKDTFLANNGKSNQRLYFHSSSTASSFFFNISFLGHHSPNSPITNLTWYGASVSTFVKLLACLCTA